MFSYCLESSDDDRFGVISRYILKGWIYSRTNDRNLDLVRRYDYQRVLLDVPDADEGIIDELERRDGLKNQFKEFMKEKSNVLQLDTILRLIPRPQNERKSSPTP